MTNEERSAPCNVALICGSALLRHAIFDQLQKITVETTEGPVCFYAPTTYVAGDEKKGGIVFVVQRHVILPSGEYSVPKEIPFTRMARGLRAMDVKATVSLCATGGLRGTIGRGSVVVVTDYFCLHTAPSISSGSRNGYVVKTEYPIVWAMRNALLSSDLREVWKHGVYSQAEGPRFETPAERRFLGTVADVAGMTGGSEMSVLMSANIEFCVCAIVDNVTDETNAPGYTIETWEEDVKKNHKIWDLTVDISLAQLKRYAEGYRTKP